MRQGLNLQRGSHSESRRASIRGSRTARRPVFSRWIQTFLRFHDHTVSVAKSKCIMRINLPVDGIHDNSRAYSATLFLRQCPSYGVAPSLQQCVYAHIHFLRMLKRNCVLPYGDDLPMRIRAGRICPPLFSLRGWESLLLEFPPKIYKY